jgi:hypothetical protein
MSGFAGISREQLRAQYVEAWRKAQAGLPLTPLEALICDVIALHGEYQALLGDAERAAAFEPDATHAAQNPFLHMGLHLAIREQISIDRPAGIRHTAERLRARFGAHEGEHALMQVLGETLWEAQRSGRAPDERDYLDRARRLLEG